MRSKELINLVESAGWVFDRIGKNHHHIFKKEGVRHHLSIPHPERSYPKGTLNQILKDAGLK